MPVVLDIWNHVGPQFGGIGPSAAALAAAVANSAGWHSRMLAVCDPGESERHVDIPPEVHTFVGHGSRPVLDIRLMSMFLPAIEASQICHVHGIWTAHAVAVGRTARRLKKPIVSSVHGMLERWELVNKRMKKEIYSLFVQRPLLARSACLRALSHQEAEEYRRFGLRNPIAIVPNGVKPISRVDSSDLLAQFPRLEGKRIVLFMARVHYKKGILDLLRAWPAVVACHPDAHLLLAGADFENTLAASKLMITEFRIQASVTFCGVLNRDAKLRALSAASFFCLPSYSEGMSMSVLEALSIGLPVVITPACNVDGVEEFGAGRVVRNRSLDLTAALTEALSLNQTQWQEMSRAAQLLARSRYDWAELGDSMKLVYEWLLGGPRPSCILS